MAADDDDDSDDEPVRARFDIPGTDLCLSQFLYTQAPKAKAKAKAKVAADDDDESDDDEPARVRETSRNHYYNRRQ